MKLIIDLSEDEIDLLALALADKSGDTLRAWHGELQYVAEKIHAAEQSPVVEYIVPKTTVG